MHRRGAPAWPLRFTGGAGEMAYDDDLVDQQVRTAVLTEIGERVIRRGYGSKLSTALFENAQALRDSLATFWTHDALQRGAPGAQVLDVQVMSEGDGLGLAIVYIVRATHQRRQTVVWLQGEGVTR